MRIQEFYPFPSLLLYWSMGIYLDLFRASKDSVFDLNFFLSEVSTGRSSSVTDRWRILIFLLHL